MRAPAPIAVPRNLAQDIADFLIREEEYAKIVFLLDCRAWLHRTFGHHHPQIEPFQSRVKGKYRSILGYSDKNAQWAWEDTLGWAESQDLVEVFKHGRDHSRQIGMLPTGEYVIDILMNAGYTLETIKGHISRTKTRVERDILLRLLMGEIPEADAIVRLYEKTQQYYRDLKNKTREYQEVLENLNERLGVDRENLNIEIIERFRIGETDVEQLAQQFEVSPLYIEILGFITDEDIPVANLASILNTTEKHIKYLRYLLVRPEPAPLPPVAQPEPSVEQVPKLVVEEPPKSVIVPRSDTPIVKMLVLAKSARLNPQKNGNFEIILIHDDGSEEPFTEITKKERDNINSDLVKHKLTIDRLRRHLKRLSLKQPELELLYLAIAERAEERIIFETSLEKEKKRRDD